MSGVVRVAILASGSSGNAAFIATPNTNILIDVGISCAQLETALQSIGESLDAIEHVFISHSHGDHSYGLRGLINRYQPNVWFTAGTARQLATKELTGVQGAFYRLTPEEITSVDSIYVLPVRVPHDDPDPVGFVILCAGVRLAFVTDIGDITRSMAQAIQDVDFLFLESNHDSAMVRANTQLPERLKDRIGLHHLGNHKVKSFIEDSMRPQVRHLMLGHVSSANNDANEVFELGRSALRSKGLSTKLSVIEPGGCSGLFTV